MTTAFQFAVYLSILRQVRTFVTELTNSFRAFPTNFSRVLSQALTVQLPMVLAPPNAVTLGFLMGAAGQFLAIALLLL